MSELQRLRITAEGYVQGIGFRWFVQDKARALSISGWVRNLSGGDVQIEAQGSKRDIEIFLNALRTEHPDAIVKGLNTEELTVQEDSADFNIRF